MLFRSSANPSWVDVRAIEKPAEVTECASRSESRVEESAVDVGDCAHAGSGGGRSEDRKAGLAMVEVVRSSGADVIASRVVGLGGAWGVGEVRAGKLQLGRPVVKERQARELNGRADPSG